MGAKEWQEIVMMFGAGIMAVVLAAQNLGKFKTAFSVKSDNGELKNGKHVLVHELTDATLKEINCRCEKRQTEINQVIKTLSESQLLQGHVIQDVSNKIQNLDMHFEKIDRALGNMEINVALIAQRQELVK